MNWYTHQQEPSDPLPLPAVEHYSDQWADGYRCAMQDVLNYLKSDGKSQIVQWTEGMLAALTASKP
jgi:hypothetical protein